MLRFMAEKDIVKNINRYDQSACNIVCDDLYCSFGNHVKLSQIIVGAAKCAFLAIEL